MTLFSRSLDYKVDFARPHPYGIFNHYIRSKRINMMEKFALIERCVRLKNFVNGLITQYWKKIKNKILVKMLIIDQVHLNRKHRGKTTLEQNYLVIFT